MMRNHGVLVTLHTKRDGEGHGFISGMITVSVRSSRHNRKSRGVVGGYFHAKDEVAGSSPAITGNRDVAQLVERVFPQTSVPDSSPDKGPCGEGYGFILKMSPVTVRSHGPFSFFSRPQEA